MCRDEKPWQPAHHWGAGIGAAQDPAVLFSTRRKVPSDSPGESHFELVSSLRLKRTVAESGATRSFKLARWRSPSHHDADPLLALSLHRFIAAAAPPPQQQCRLSRLQSRMSLCWPGRRKVMKPIKMKKAYFYYCAFFDISSWEFTFHHLLVSRP